LLYVEPGNSVRYLSIDPVPEQDEAIHYPMEFLNSLDPPRMPSQILELKEGRLIMLLMNLDPWQRSVAAQGLL
ncbi:ATP-dependent DNA helicase, partial [Caligus rogercresseyi]